MSKLIIDLRGFEGVKSSLQQLLGKDFSIFEYHLKECIDNKHFNEIIDAEYLVENELIDMDSWSIEDIHFKIYHFTTRKSLNACKDTIWDLPSVLTKETDLKKFLLEFQISFDLENHMMRVGDKFYDLKSEDRRIRKIASKIYIDPEVWGFLRVLDIRKYQDVFPEKPEFIRDILEFLGYSSKFNEKWKQEYGNPYVIEFELPLESLQIYTNSSIYFNKSQYLQENYIDEDEFSLDEFRLHQKYMLVNLLIKTYFGVLKRYAYDELYGKVDDLMDSIQLGLSMTSFLKNYEEELQQIIVCLNKGEHVCREQIIKVWEFEDFQLKAKLNNGYLY